MNISEIYSVFKESTGICTDTRKIEKGNLFFALKGPNFNANKLAKEALEKGAIAVIIDNKDYTEDKTIFVEDALITLQKLAIHHRNQFDIPFIGITGSNGKTSTKELIVRVLETKYNVHYTLGNLNNHIGVPLTLLSLNEDAEIAVIEMGANKLGDIKELCDIADPDFGIITNIGKAHLEGFGSLEGVARTKSELYVHILKKGGKIFVNSTDEHLMRMASRFEEIIKFPQKGDFYECEFIESSPYIVFKDGDRKVQTNLLGKYNFYNMASALCIGKYFKVNTEKAIKAIAEYKPDMNRSQVEKKGSNTIILDAYNANPSSMKAAVLNLDEIKATHKMAILGDMFELGEESKQEHADLGELVAECDSIGKCIFVGKDMKYANLKHTMSLHFETTEECMEYLKLEKIENTTLLIKGSRGMALERVMEVI